jgi:putative ABC transport system permease protein
MNRSRILLAPVLLASRRIRSDPPVAAAVFGVVLVTSFVFAAVPRTFERNADEGVRFAVARANPFARNVEITKAGRISPGPGADSLVPVSAAGVRLQQSFPESLQRVLQGRRAVVETVRYTVVDPPGRPGPPGTTRLLTLESVQGTENHARGRFPGARAASVPLPFRGEQDDAPLVEVAISQEAAAQLSVGVGDRLYLAPDPEDPLVDEVALSERSMFAVEVSGLLTPRATGDKAWLQDARLGRAVTRDTDFRRYVYGYALFAGPAYGQVARATQPLPLRYAWRYEVDASNFEARDFDRLEADVRLLDSRFGETTFGQRLGTGVRTGLSEVLAGYRADRDASAAVFAVGATGLLALALAVLALLAGLAADRRGEGIALLRSRGGSTWQVLGAEAVEGIALALPAGAVGYLGARLAVDGHGASLSLWLVAAIVAATGVILAAAAAGPARRGVGGRGRDEVAVPTLSPRRLAVEALVVLLSAVGVYLLRRRGLTEEGGGFDPYLAAVPLLLGLAAGILAVRLYPLPVRLLAAATSRRPDLVPALAFRRVARQPGVTTAPLLVLLLGVSVSVFAAAVGATLAEAQAGAQETSLSPLATGTAAAFRAGAVLAGAYAAAVLVLAPLLAARSRLRDLAYLRALGLSRAQAVRITAAELAPVVVASLVFGTFLGVAVVYLVEPGLDLNALAAGERKAAVRLDPLASGLLLVALLLVSAAAVRVTGLVMRGTSISRVLRMGDR